MSVERLTEVFQELKAGLVPLLREIQEKVKEEEEEDGGAAARRRYPSCLHSGDEWDVEEQVIYLFIFC
ncbi:unnamed protein product [Choristocarpus tenellus]